MSFVPLRSPDDARLIEIIRAYITENSDAISRPDMSSEYHLLAVAKLIVDETRALNQVKL